MKPKQNRKLSSHYALTPQGLLPGAILSFDSLGVVTDIELSDSIDSHHSVEFYGGLLLPTVVVQRLEVMLKASPWGEVLVDEFVGQGGAGCIWGADSVGGAGGFVVGQCCGATLVEGIDWQRQMITKKVTTRVIICSKR